MTVLQLNLLLFLRLFFDHRNVFPQGAEDLVRMEREKKKKQPEAPSVVDEGDSCSFRLPSPTRRQPEGADRQVMPEGAGRPPESDLGDASRNPWPQGMH